MSNANFDAHISLGSACEVAIQLRGNGLRNSSHCFDWVWNQEGGLINIIEILQDDFQKLLNPSNYCVCNRFKVKNKYYPDMGFPHNKLLLKEGWETYKRRIKRTQKTFKTTTRICFVYFRDSEIVIDEHYKRIRPKIINYEEQLRLFKEETIFFREVVNMLYPKLDYHLKALYRIYDNDSCKIIKDILRTFNEDKITYNVVIGNNKDSWTKSIKSRRFIN